MASEFSSQRESGGNACEDRAKWIGARATDAPTFSAWPNEKRSAGIAITRSASRRARATVPSVDPESTTMISLATVWPRSRASTQANVLALFFVRTITLARGMESVIAWAWLASRVLLQTTAPDTGDLRGLPPARPEVLARANGFFGDSHAAILRGQHGHAAKPGSIQPRTGPTDRASSPPVDRAVRGRRRLCGVRGVRAPAAEVHGRGDSQLQQQPTQP